MSDYQYYEFQAIDRRLTAADRRDLRAISSRAEITATSFTNSYEWGDFKGDPLRFMERWFDLHLYVANWGARRLMMRFPKRLLDQKRIKAFLRKADCAHLTVSGENLILDIERGEIDTDDWYDGAGQLDALAPLRTNVLGGDLRLFYLIWLMAAEDGALSPDTAEPLPGLGPMTDALAAFVEFFAIDPDLVAAAAERAGPALQPSQDELRRCISALPDSDKTAFLVRLAEGDPLVASELRALMQARARPAIVVQAGKSRTASELLARASEIAEARAIAEAKKATAKQRLHEKEVEKALQARRAVVARKGETAWREVEGEIARRNRVGYDCAAELLSDLRVIAKEHGAEDEFTKRLDLIRSRHAAKGKFIERIRTIA